MVRAIMCAEGLPLRYSRRDLEAFAAEKAMVVLRPVIPAASDPQPVTNRRLRIGNVAVAALAIVASIVAAYRFWLRPWHLHWGATAAEVSKSLPGDEIVAGANFVSTRALTIAAAPERVWAWLVQIGQGRGGFYSYDLLENLTGLKIYSAHQIEAHLQHLAPGDVIAVEPGGSGYSVVAVEPGRLLLLQLDGKGPGRWALNFVWLMRPPLGHLRFIRRQAGAPG
jgi:hypothetical protein